MQPTQLQAGDGQLYVCQVSAAASGPNPQQRNILILLPVRMLYLLILHTHCKLL